MDTKDVLILTKSAKHGEYCVAGIDLQTRQWIRLVSSEQSTMYALTRNMIVYDNHRECDILDIVRVKIVEKMPLEIQRENVLIDEGEYFEFLGRANIDALEDYLDNDFFIYGDNASYISRTKALSFGYSLRMYKVKNPILSEHENNKGNMRRKLSFEYNGMQYNNWSMTDYQYYKVPVGKLADEAVIIVSIPEDDYYGNYYKFVAQIFV